MDRHILRDGCWGAAAGLLGAGCMGLVALCGAMAAGGRWYSPLELIGGVATGSSARLDEGLQREIAAVGAIVDLATGAVWGGFFGALVGVFKGDVTSRESASIGATFGIIVWVVDLYVFMPLADPGAALAIPLWFGAVLHVGYGATLGATWPFLRGPDVARSAGATKLRRRFRSI